MQTQVFIHQQESIREGHTREGVNIHDLGGRGLIFMTAGGGNVHASNLGLNAI